MGFLDVFSLFVLLLIGCLVVGLLLLLAWLPGDIARKRHSPWAQPINVAGWIGILFPPIWMLALIAAFVRPSAGEGAAIAITEAQTAELASTIASISTRMATLESGMRASRLKIVAQRTGGPRP